MSRKKKTIKVGITGNFQPTDLFYLDSELDFFDKCICFQYLEGHVPELVMNDDYSFPRIINASQCKRALRHAICSMIKSYIAAVLFLGLMIFSVLLLKYNLSFPRVAIIPFLQYTGFFALLTLLCFAGYVPYYLTIFNRFCKCGLDFYMKSPELCEKYLAWERKILQPCTYSADDFIPQPSYRLRGIKLIMEPDDLYAILEHHLDNEYDQIGCTRRARGRRGLTHNSQAPFNNTSIAETRESREKRTLFFLWGLLLVLAITPVFLIKYTLSSTETHTIAGAFSGILFTLNLASIGYLIYQIRELYISKRVRRILERFKNRANKEDDILLAIRAHKEAENKAAATNNQTQATSSTPSENKKNQINTDTTDTQSSNNKKNNKRRWPRKNNYSKAPKHNVQAQSEAHTQN